MIVAVHAVAHLAINCVPINWNLPISFGMFRRAERAAEKRQFRPVTAQDLECPSPGKGHRRRGKSYPDKAVSHGPIYNRCNDFLEEALRSALADQIAYPIAAEAEAISTSSINSPNQSAKETPSEAPEDASSLDAEQVEKDESLKNEPSSATDEAIMEDDTDDSVSESVFYMDVTTSNNSTPAASPWGSLEPEATLPINDKTETPQVSVPKEASQVLATTDQHSGTKTSVSINRTENGELDIIGKGTFGSVYKGNYRGKEVAIKLTGVPTFRKETEGQVFAHVGNHSHIISLHTFYHDGFGQDKLETLIFDYAASDLCRMVKLVTSEPKRKMSVDYVAFVADCLANALTHIHQRGYAHLDMSPANVLIMSDGVPKLADFSSSLKWKEGDEPLEVYPIGTVGFRAPEIIERLGYDTTADWFSLGVLIFYMFNGRLPWARDNNAQMRFIRKGLPCLSDHLPESFVTFVTNLLADDPDDRIPAMSFISDETEL